MARYETANTIINDTALEVGLVPVNDVYSSQDENFTQLRGLLTVSGRELIQLNDWSILEDVFDLNTSTSSPASGTPPDNGLYDLPEDFSHMIDQTGWNRDGNVPVGGPLSPQVWSTLVGRDLGSTTIYASFRLTENQIRLYPNPAPEDTDLSFMYQSRNWVLEEAGTRKDRPSLNTDIILFDPILIGKYLKVKWLSAKGLDITIASRELDNMFNSITGKDKGGQVLNAGGGVDFPYLNPWRNMSDTGYGAF